MQREKEEISNEDKNVEERKQGLKENQKVKVKRGSIAEQSRATYCSRFVVGDPGSNLGKGWQTYKQHIGSYVDG